MTDRIIVSRKALEIAYSSGGMAMERDLREIIDTAEEAEQVTRKEAIEQAFRTLSEMPSEEFRAALAAIPPESAKVFEPFLGHADSAWITDRPPTVEEVGDDGGGIVTLTRGDRTESDVWNGQTIRRRWGTTPTAWDVTAWQPLPAPFTPPVKRLCWCGAEMVLQGQTHAWWAECSIGISLHGTGPSADTESEAWAAYDRMVGR